MIMCSGPFPVLQRIVTCIVMVPFLVWTAQTHNSYIIQHQQFEQEQLVDSSILSSVSIQQQQQQQHHEQSHHQIPTDDDSWGLPFRLEDIKEVLCGGRKCLLVLSTTKSKTTTTTSWSNGTNTDHIDDDPYDEGYLVAVRSDRYIRTRIDYLLRKDYEMTSNRTEMLATTIQTMTSINNSSTAKTQNEMEMDHLRRCVQDTLQLQPPTENDKGITYLEDLDLDQIMSSSLTPTSKTINMTISIMAWLNLDRMVQFEKSLMQTIRTFSDESTNNKKMEQSSSSTTLYDFNNIPLFNDPPIMIYVADKPNVGIDGITNNKHRDDLDFGEESCRGIEDIILHKVQQRGGPVGGIHSPNERRRQQQQWTIPKSTVAQLEQFITMNRTQFPQREPNGKGYRDTFSDKLTAEDIQALPSAQILQPLILQRVRVIPSPRLKVQIRFDLYRIHRPSFHRKFLDQIFSPSEEKEKNQTTTNNTRSSHHHPHQSPYYNDITTTTFMQNLHSGMTSFKHVLDVMPCMFADLQFVVDRYGHVRHIDLDRCFETSDKNAAEPGMVRRRKKHLDDFVKQMISILQERY